MDTPLGDESGKTIGDILESEETCESAYADDDAILLIQGYINRNKIIEAILLDNIAFNNVQRYSKKTIKTTNSNGDAIKYVEYSSEFWAYKLVQIVSKLPSTYKNSFMTRYHIAEDKLTSVLETIECANNQKLYKYLRNCLDELRVSYA
jgi:hypothetical protein